MTKPPLIVRLYALLLRLYPRQFRITFAEEMTDVFAAALAENRQEGTLPLIGLISWELCCLPYSIIREQIHERSENHIWQGAMNMSNLSGAYRLGIILLLAIIAVYLGLVIAPFFIYGINQQPYFEVIGGVFDPKGYPLFDYNTDFGSILHLFAILMIVIAPAWSIIFGGVLSLHLLRYWRWLLKSERRFRVAILMVNLALLAFMFSPLGRLIIIWHMD